MADPTEVAFGQLLVGGIGFMVLAAGALLGFLTIYQRRLLQQQIQLQATEAAHQQELLLAIVESQENERERIGQDLHDGIGSLLATAKLLTGKLRSIPATEIPAELPTHIYNLISTSVQDVRSISHNLYPAALTRYGLAEALQHLVNVSNETEKLPIELDIIYTRPMPLAQELALYRICQELIHNAIKHATGATQLLVQLQQGESLLTLVVEDNGTSSPQFLPGTTIPVASGTGLRSIELRVQLLSACLRQDVIPGQGWRTTIELRMPS